MRTLLPIFVLALCASVPASGQAIRFDSTATTTSAQCVSGKQCPLLVLPGTQVNFCQGTPSTLSACLASPATTYKDASAGVACATTAQLTPGTGGSCIATADAQGGYGAWFLPGSYGYYLRVPVTAGGGTYGPYALSIHGDSGGYTLDSLYSTLAQACTAAGTGTLAVTRVWSATPSQTLACTLWFLGDGTIQPSSGQTVVFKVQGAPLSRICDVSLGGHCTITSYSGLLYPQWWGVKTDGTNTSAALKEAIQQSASATAPQTLFFPPGPYKLTVETDPQGYFNMDCGGKNQVTITTTGAIIAINQTGDAVSMLNCTWRQSDTAAVQFLHAKRSGGGLSGNVKGNTFVSLSATAVSAVVLEDNVNTLVHDNFFAGPCYSSVSGCGADSPGSTTTRTAIGLQLTAPSTNTNTTVGLVGNYFQGWKYGFDVTGGYGIQITNVNIFQNNWIGIHGVGGPAGSFRWGVDGNWFENNKYNFSGSTGNGGAFFGDPASPTTNTLAVAPRLVVVTQNNYFNGNYDFIGGPSIQKSLNYTDVTAGTTDMNYSLGGPDAAHSKALFQRTAASDEPIIDVPCGNPDVTKPCIDLLTTTSQQAGQPSKARRGMSTLDAASAPWWNWMRSDGATLYIESVNDPVSPSTWNAVHFPNGTGSDCTIGGGTGNGVCPGDWVALNSNGTMRIGAVPVGAFGVAGGFFGTTTNVDVTGIRNSTPILTLKANGTQLLVVGVYANNAAALGAGLATGTIYRITGTDTLGVVH